MFKYKTMSFHLSTIQKFSWYRQVTYLNLNELLHYMYHTLQQLVEDSTHTLKPKHFNSLINEVKTYATVEMTMLYYNGIKWSKLSFPLCGTYCVQPEEEKLK